MPPLPSTFDEETTGLIDSVTRLQKDLSDVQLPRLRACIGPLVLQQTLAAEIREDIDGLTRKVEALDLLVWDQKGEKNRRELRVVVDKFREGLVELRQESRGALLASKKTIDSQSKSKREELLSSSAVTEQQLSNEKVTDDALMKAHNDVTGALRRTINLMQGELERSVLSTQLLDTSTTSLKSTSSAHDRLTDLMGTSKQLVTALEKSDWLDRMLIISAFIFFLLVVMFIVKQRVIDRGLRIAFWWTRFLPDFSGDEKLLNLDKAALTSSLSDIVSGAVTVSSTLSSSLATTAMLSSSSTSTPTPDGIPTSMHITMDSTLLASTMAFSHDTTSSSTVAHVEL
ncbi:hypothetical protein AX15_003700 [Amanita polypyramis BW_CC]|nr:hypothetical protein AX15_003700 [Amanita polypyramis BW_CC]